MPKKLTVSVCVCVCVCVCVVCVCGVCVEVVCYVNEVVIWNIRTSSCTYYTLAEYISAYSNTNKY